MVRLRHTVLALLLLALAAPARATDQCPARLGELQCYEIKPAAFPRIPVSVEDRFGQVAYPLRYPHRFCTPAGAGPSGGVQVGYSIRPAAATAVTQHIVNRFGTFELEVRRPSLLLVPSRDGAGAPPPATSTDFQCWQVKRAPGSPRPRSVRGVEVDTGFERATVDLLRPVRLCVPASTDGRDPGAVARPEQLLCFQTRSRQRFGGFDVLLENRFEADAGTLIHRRELCVPSVDDPGPGVTTTLPPACATTTTTTSTTTSTTTTTTTTTTTSTTTTTTSTTTTSTSLPVRQARCGDGTLDAGEQCDDGNTAPGDCCSPTCVIDPDGAPCTDGDACNGVEACHAGRCEPPDSCRTSFLTAAISNFRSNTVSLLDGATGAVTATVPVGNGPWGVAPHPLGTEIWVTNRKDASVSVIDVAARAVTATIPVGRVPLGIVLDPTGTRAYVASYGGNHVDVVDTATRARVGRFRVDRGPAGLAFDATGRTLYVTGFGANTLQALDPTTGRVLARVRTGRKPLQLAIDDARGRVYVANFGGGSVSVIGTVSRSVLATISLPGKPFGIAVDPVRGRLFVSDSGGERVAVVDTADDRVVGALPVPPGPLGVALDPAGRVLVTSGNAGVVSVVDPETAAGGAASVGSLPVAFGQFVGTVSADCAGSAPRCTDVDPTVAGSCAPRAGCQFVARPDADALAALLAALADTVRTLPAPSATATALADAAERARQALATGATATVRADLQRIVATARTALRRRDLPRDAALRVLDLARRTRVLLRRTR